MPKDLPMSLASASLADVIAALAPLRPAAGTFIVGITGSVAAGKSVFAAGLKAAYEAETPGLKVETACSDGFLHPNAVLTEAGLMQRKGFPESYDHAALAAALTSIREGVASFPVHSPTVYDIDPALTRTLTKPDILILEGLALPPASLDALIYLDADEAHLTRWFINRFMGLWEAAQGDPAAFYSRFPTRENAQVVAGYVWDQVNLPNLRDHILAARDDADLVVTKGPDHQIARIVRANVSPMTQGG